MIKNKVTWFVMAVMAVASCTVKEGSEQMSEVFPDGPVFEGIIEEYADVATKAYADENLKVLWHKDDRVSVFNRFTYNQEYRYTGEEGANTGSFALIPNGDFITGNELSDVYAVYPYKTTNSINNSGILSVVLPAEQSYCAGSFGRGDNTMIAVTDSDALLFRNLCGYLMFKLYGAGLKVTSLSLEANDGEALAGKATVNMAPGGVPEASIASEGSSSKLTLICDTPVSLGTSEDDYTEFWFVVPPVTMSQGFKLTVNLSDGSVFEKSTSNAVTITRNRRSRMSPIMVEHIGDFQPDNEIWYTSEDGAIIEPHYPDRFNTAIVSNTYENGKGIIRFAGTLTEIGEAAFWGCGFVTLQLPQALQVLKGQVFGSCGNLETLNIPESVTKIGGYNCFVYCRKLESFTGKFASKDKRALVVDGKMVGFAQAGLTEYTVDDSVIDLGGVFAYCSQLTRVTLPSTLQIISYEAFEECSGLTELVLPSSLRSIGNYAFRGCTGLKSICIPGSVTSIGSGSFDNCSSLSSFSGKYASEDGHCLIVGTTIKGLALSGVEDFIVPEGVTDTCPIIGFNGLKTIIFPTTITTLGQVASCNNLQSITMRATTPAAKFTRAMWPANGAPWLFMETNDCPIYVPEASVKAYREADTWSDYSVRIRIDPTMGPFMEISPLEIGLSSSAQSFVVKVSTNMEYHADIADNSSWITAGEVLHPGTYEYVHKFYVTKNDGDAREGLISFCDNNSNCHPVIVTQRQFESSWENMNFVHHSLGMRFTATWCSMCPYMNDAFLKARKILGEKYNYVMLHASSSDLKFTGTSSLSALYGITGLPTGVIDGRRIVKNSSNTNAVCNNIVEYVQETENNYPVVTGIAVKSSLSGRSLSLDIDAYVKNPELYKITVLLLEDGVVSFQADSEGGDKDDYVHDKIARMSLTDIRGDQFETTQYYTVKNFSYAVDIPAAYNTDNMSVLVYIHRQFGYQQVLQTSASFGEYYIDNCRIVPLGQNAALETE